jgi:hypothetical protein
MPPLEDQVAEQLEVQDLRGGRHALRFTYWLNSSSSGRWDAFRGFAGWAGTAGPSPAGLSGGLLQHGRRCLGGHCPSGLPVPNSRSTHTLAPPGRMYILEGTSELLKSYCMRPGDVLVVARATGGGLLMAGRQGGQVRLTRDEPA